MDKIVECVPNISEGRDREKIDYVVKAAASAKGVSILDIDPGADTNRTVITFAGTPDAVLEGAFRLIRAAAEVIDMRNHRGEHPRMGAVDVCPFVPVSGVTMEECVELSKLLGMRVASELKIPIYLYEHAATSPERMSLANIRKGEYEGLAEKLKSPNWKPDFGGVEFNAKAGATVIGARPFLIAYNVNLNTKSKKTAIGIAKAIREIKGPKKDENQQILRDKEGNEINEYGMFKCCRAIGWVIESYGCAQISINLTDHKVTGLHDVFDACDELARAQGVRVTGSELVGLVPKEALLVAGRHYLKKQGSFSAVSESALVHAAVRSLGLSDVQPFDSGERIIEEKLKSPTPLANMSIHGFVDELASESVAPGGGSVAALAGSLSGALSAMVCSLTYGKPNLSEHHPKVLELGQRAQEIKALSLRALDDDTKAFLDVISAMRGVPKNANHDSPEYVAAKKSLDEAYKRATQIPLSVAIAAVDALEIGNQVAGIGLEAALSDVAVSGVMARGAFLGGAYNVRINLPQISDQAFVKKTATTLQDLEGRADKLLSTLLSTVDSRLNHA